LIFSRNSRLLAWEAYMWPGYKGHLTIAFAIFAAASSIRVANATAFTNPAPLDRGGTVAPIPDGYSGTDFLINPPPFFSIPFDFEGGPSGTLGIFVDQYVPVVDPAHPFGSDYHFGFEITLSSGEVSSFSVDGYAPFEVAVKQCSLPMCGDPNARNGLQATEVSRTTDGDELTFSFAGLSGAGAHSAGLELFTNATSVADPQAIFEDSEGNLFSISVPGPIVSVPETCTWVMLATGFAGIALLRRRARNEFNPRPDRATS
jgi:hypothetical protein